MNVSAIIRITLLALAASPFSAARGMAQKVLAPENATKARADAPGYILRDGTTHIVTPASLEGVTRRLNDVYLVSHPGVRFSVAAGDNYSAMSALTFDRSLIAPLGCEYTRIGLGNNLKIAGEPLPVKLAHATLTPGAGVPALGIIVNNSNPLTSLSLPQLRRIFTIGSAGGDIAIWQQAGVNGALAGRSVVPLGPLASDYMDSDDPQAGEFLSTAVFASENVNHAYVPLPHYADIVSRVAEDPAAIGIIALNVPHDGVKVVALKATDFGVAVLPAADTIASGRYPLDRFVYLYLRQGKGLPLDPQAVAYAQAALSAEGQKAVAADRAGYTPLNDGELAGERAKLQR